MKTALLAIALSALVARVTAAPLIRIHTALEFLEIDAAGFPFFTLPAGPPA